MATKRHLPPTLVIQGGSSSGALNSPLLRQRSKTSTPSAKSTSDARDPTPSRNREEIENEFYARMRSEKLQEPTSPTAQRMMDVGSLDLHVNPFVYNTPPDLYEKIKIFIMSFTIFPIRILLLLACLLLMYVFMALSLLGVKSDPTVVALSRWRRVVLLPVAYLARVALFICGYYWITETGRPAAPSDAPIVTPACHSGPMEGLYFAWKISPSIMSTSENKANPLLRTFINSAMGIWVDRRAKDSRHDALETMRRRCIDERGTWPQICLFPEGLCTNRSSVVTFKHGAFTPGVPVQPVAFSLPYVHFNFCTLATGPSTGKMIHRLLCQVFNSMEVTWLPVHVPSDLEKERPAVFAMNVQQDIAQVLGVPTTEHTYEDVRLSLEARQAHLPATAGVIEFGALRDCYNMSFENSEALLQRFVEYDINHDGRIDLQEFSAALHLPVHDRHVEHLFAMLDQTGAGSLDFREFLVGMLFLSKQCDNTNAVGFAFRVFDTAQKGGVNLTQFNTIMHILFPALPTTDVEAVFNAIDKNKDGSIDKTEFEAYAKAHPEFMKIFIDEYKSQQEGRAKQN